MLDRVMADVRDARRLASGRAVVTVIESRIENAFEIYEPVDPEFREIYLELCRIRSKSQSPRKDVRDLLRELIRHPIDS